jgi:octaprenyl-diphosphate synthase
LTTLGKVGITETEYFDILQRKTAFLFSACCEIGGILGQAGNEQQAALRDYGMNLGIAFQLADDWLDFTADEEILGKASGADLLEGKITLPLLLLQQKEPEVRAELEQIMHDGHYRTVSRESLLLRLEKHGLLDETRQRAFSFAEKAKKSLEFLSDSKYREALEEIPTYMIERNK